MALKPFVSSNRLSCWVCGLCFLFLFSAISVQAQPLRVGVYHNPPKIFISPQGKITGIFGDLVNKMAETQGWEIEVVPCSWEECLRLTQNGEIDLMPDV
ncbi:MAG: hypothetical protein CML17_07755, partial [Pusillimonas sp.]|nr:hypothetical protein [Pusillimonas sp.]